MIKNFFGKNICVLCAYADKKKQVILYLQLLILTLLISCNQTQQNKPILLEPVYNSKSFSEQLLDISQSSMAFAHILTKNRIVFVENIVNNTYNFRDYRIDLNVSAANIGIYAADAQYLKAYNHNAKANLSSNSAKQLLKLIKNNKLNTTSAKIQSGYNTNDSTFFVLNKALKDSANNFTEFERKQYLLSIMIGSFVEKNYLLLNAINSNLNFNEVGTHNILHLIKLHNNQLSKIFLLTNKYFKRKYNSYLRDDLKRYNDYYLENSDKLIQSNNQSVTTLVVQNLLLQITQIRNYIINAEILLPNE